ncbi:MAG: ABC transporter ATP-binding protein, partial [Campylobacter sp.]|nr:ABC transporter ATP-binding protein [Campylobacter sp.]
QEKTADINSVLSEIYSNIEIVKANNAQKSEIKRFSEENYRIYRLNFKAIITNGLVSPLMEMLGGIGIAVVIYIGGKEVIEGSMTLGKFTSFVAALFMLYTPIKKVTSVFNNMQDAIVASNRTFELIDKTPSIIGGKKEFPKNINSLSFQNVSLNYGEKTALKNINFSVNKGQTIALVGNSGGGKTSIVNLIMRFYDTTSGNILVNNDDLCEFSLESLRENIGFVSQRIYIFNDTIANNVAYGKTYDEEKVINALKSANAYEFVMGLENGIHTNLNEFGTNISGGQRQRIAIARALYNNPQILIFDEATSALDNVSEKAITEVIEKIKTDKIVFIIAHRLSTIENAGKIAVISNGEIVGFGDDEKLVRECEIYQKLKGNFAYENKDTSEK